MARPHHGREQATSWGSGTLRLARQRRLVLSTRPRTGSPVEAPCPGAVLRSQGRTKR